MEERGLLEQSTLLKGRFCVVVLRFAIRVWKGEMVLKPVAPGLPRNSLKFHSASQSRQHTQISNQGSPFSTDLLLYRKGQTSFYPIYAHSVSPPTPSPPRAQTCARLRSLSPF